MLHWWHWFRRRVPAPGASWQVAQPDYEALCALCHAPVTLMPRVGAVAYLETCVECGVVIDRAYTGPRAENASVCAACAAKAVASAQEDDATGEEA